ncbi:MAG: tRNA pseudouridine(13) synthase TruD [Desulfobacteraceae bacterium]|nr:tRNA pseudouridine(13) synthase TruD [Desulfobacteraceae bacterium]
MEEYQQSADALKAAMRQLPYLSADLPGIGGAIKEEPEHFQVEEVLPYAACGQGEHLYVTLRRKLWNTADVAAALGKCFGLKSADIGWGGRKDKQAVTTQTFSLLLPLSMPMEEIRARLSALPFEILDLNSHRNKIKTGHVAANRFRILLSQTAPGSIVQAQAIAAAVLQRGLPNFFGEQRFGREMSNLDRAMGMVAKKHSPRSKQDDLMVSALQSALFNLWLTRRMARGHGNQIIAGDVAQKTDTGGLFVVEDLVEAQQRFSQSAIVYTGPIFGFKMKAAALEAASFEQQILDEFQMDSGTFKQLKAPGSRREALLRLPDLAVKPVEAGLWFSFTLPAGAYATTVLREFMR